MKRSLLFTFVLLITFNHANGQLLKIKDYGFSYRIYESSLIGNNPMTLHKFIKDPYSYNNLLNQINYNSIYGNPGIINLKTFYLFSRFVINNPESKFWRKNNFQLGLFATQKVTESSGGFSNNFATYSPDTVFHTHSWMLTRNIQHFGIQAGLNRCLNNPMKEVKLYSGILIQGGLALMNNYDNSFDTATFSSRQGWQHQIKKLPDIKGKNYFQWQLMIPFGIEFPIIQRKIYIRADVNAGITGNSITNTFDGAHGIGAAIIYKIAP